MHLGSFIRPLKSGLFKFTGRAQNLSLTGKRSLRSAKPIHPVPGDRLKICAVSLNFF